MTKRKAISPIMATLLLIAIVVVATIAISVFAFTNRHQTSTAPNPQGSCPEGMTEEWIGKCIWNTDYPLYSEQGIANWTENYAQAKITGINYIKLTNTTQIQFAPPIRDAFYDTGVVSKSIAQLNMTGKQYFDRFSLGDVIIIHYNFSYSTLTWYAKNGTLVQGFCNNDGGFCRYPTFTLIDIAPLR